MTAPPRTFQNISYAELLACAENNPNRSRTLAPILRVNTEDTSMLTLCLPGYSSCMLTPANHLSVIACIQDPIYYSLAAPNARLQQLIDLSTSLQLRTDELKTSSLMRKRKKIYELIGAVYNGAHLDDKDNAELYAGLGHMCEIQFVLMKEAIHDKIEDDSAPIVEDAVKGEVIFSSDPTTWSREKPVWIADFRGRWVAVPTEGGTVCLLDWLNGIEQRGWIIQWPLVEGTKVELIERLSALPSWKETDRKLIKDVLAQRMGRILTQEIAAHCIVSRMQR